MALDDRTFIADSNGRLGPTSDAVLCWAGGPDIEKAKSIWFDYADGRRLWIRGKDVFEDATKPPPPLTTACLRTIDGRPALVVPLKTPVGEVGRWLRWYQAERRRRAPQAIGAPRAIASPEFLQWEQDRLVRSVQRVWKRAKGDRNLERRRATLLKALRFSLDTWTDAKAKGRVEGEMARRLAPTARRFVDRILAAFYHVDVRTIDAATQQEPSRKK